MLVLDTELTQFAFLYLNTIKDQSPVELFQTSHHWIPVMHACIDTIKLGMLSFSSFGTFVFLRADITMWVAFFLQYYGIMP